MKDLHMYTSIQWVPVYNKVFKSVQDLLKKNKKIMNKIHWMSVYCIVFLWG